MNGLHNELPQERYEYTIEVTIRGTSDEYVPIARAQTPEGAGEVVRALCANHEPQAQYVRVITRRVL